MVPPLGSQIPVSHRWLEARPDLLAAVRAGGDSAGQNLRTSTYTRNLLNQIGTRTVPGTVDLMGFAPAANTVTFATPPGGTPMAADFRSGDFFQKALSWSNSAAARFEGVDISTDGQLGPEETRWVFLPKTPEWFSHDLDGNLLTDGKWIYTWDGENRLISMETSGDSGTFACRALGSRPIQSQPVRTPGVSSWVRQHPLELSESRVDGRRG